MLGSLLLKSPRPYSWAFLFAVLVFLGHLAIVLLVPSQDFRIAFTYVSFPLTDLLATIALGYAARRSACFSRRLGLAWGALALAQLSYSLGGLTWGLAEIVFHQQPFPSLADAFYLAYYPLFFLGVVLLPAVRFRWEEWVKIALDLVIVLLVSALGFWFHVIEPILHVGAGKPWLVQALALAYPVGDLILFWAFLGLLYGRSSGQNRAPLCVLAASLIAMIAFDVAFSYQSLVGVYEEGGLVDLGYLLVTLLVGLAGVLQGNASPGRQEPAPNAERRISPWLSYFPYAWIGFAYLLLILPLPGRPAAALPAALTAAVGTVIALVMVRQILTLAENSRLARLQAQAMQQIQRQAVELQEANRALTAEIAERKRSEEQLRLSKERYRSMFNQIPVALYRTTPQGQILNANPAMVELLGYPDRRSLLAQTAPQLYVDPSEREKQAALVRQEGVVRGYRLHLRRFDGRPIWVRDTCRLLRDEQGRQIYEGALEDITEQVQAEQSAAVVAARAQALAEIAHRIAAAGLDLQAVLDIVTRRMVELVGDFSLVMLVSGEELRLASLHHPQPEKKEIYRKLLTTVKQPLGTGLQGRAIETGQPVVCNLSLEGNDAIVYPEYREVLKQEAIHHLLFVPLCAQGQVMGVLGVLRGQPKRPFDDEERVFVQSIADRAALAVGNAQLYERAQRSLSKVQALRQIDIAITGSLDLRLSLGAILEQVLIQTGMDAANVLVLDPNTLSLEYAAGRGFRTRTLEYIRLGLGESYAGRAAREQRPVCIPDLTVRRTDFLRTPAFHSESFVFYLAVPLIAKSQVKGVLEVYRRTPFEPDPEWLEFLEALAGQAAIAIDNTRLFTDLQTSNRELILAYDATIAGWSHALDLRDKETEGHSRRVTEMTLRLARQMHVPEAELVHVRRGALLHDIGKMGIPDAILLKPGPLTPEEWDIMRQHPVYAHQMLAPIAYLKPAMEIPYCHHEKWDGTGYPRGLKGEEIPLAARIFAVVDVWDALCSDRPYRPAWKEDQALEHIRSQAGKHFDPQVVTVFLSEKPWIGIE